MQIIPNLPVLQDDELLISYLFRIAMENGRNAQLSSIKWFFSFSGNKFGDSIINLAENLNVASIDFFRKTTMFNYFQLMMTRKEVKNAIEHIFGNAHANNNDYYYLTAPVQNKEVYYCPDCMVEDCEEYGFKYIHHDHQLLGFCFKHHRKLDIVSPQQFFSTPVPKQKSPLPTAKEYETSFTRHIYSVIRFIQNNDIVINYEDATSIIDSKFGSGHLFTLEKFINLERKVDRFVTMNWIEQDDFLGEFFLYYQHSKGNGFRLSDYPIALIALLASSVASPLDIKPLLKHYENDEFWLQLLMKSTTVGLEIVSDKDGSILEVKNSRTQVTKIVSAYSILDTKKP